MHNNEYIKTKSKNTSHGFDYQLDWCMLFILRAHHLYCKELISDFKIACENEAAEDFDDITITLVDNRGQSMHVFMQLKHRSGKNNIFGQRELSEEKGDFSIAKYFKSYQKIKQRKKYKIEEICYMILHTNIDMRDNANNNFLEEQMEKEILIPLGDQAKYYRIKDKCIQNYVKNDTDDEKMFFGSRFLVGVNQPDGTNLKDLILKEFHGLTKEILDHMLEDLKTWINNKEGYYIDVNNFQELRRKAFGTEQTKFQLPIDIKEDVSQKKINEIEEFYSNEDMKVGKFYFSITDKLSVLKAVQNASEKEKKAIIYVTNYEDFERSKEIFWISKGEILIVNCETTIRYNDNELLCQLCWKIIVLLEDYELQERVLVPRIPHIKHSVEEQENVGIYTEKNSFQKCQKKLSLLIKKGDNCYSCVEQFKGDLKFLIEVSECSENFSNSHCVNCNFKNGGMELQLFLSGKSEESCGCCFSKNYLDEKHIILSDESGTGKSSFLKILQNNFREDKLYKDHQIIYIDSSSSINLLVSCLKTPNSRVIVLFDALDDSEVEEFDIDFETIKELCKNNENVKIFWTCNLDFKQKLENTFGVFCWSFLPLSIKDQEKILLKCCAANIDYRQIIYDINHSKISDVLQNILNFKLFSSVLSDLYGSGKTYEMILSNDKGLPELYEKIVNLKIDIWLKNKVKISPKKVLDEKKKDLLVDLENLSFHNLFKKPLPAQKVLGQFSLNIGFVTVGSNMKTIFLHKTFAEFFAARKIVHCGLDKNWLKKIFLTSIDDYIGLQDPYLNKKGKFLRKCIEFNFKNTSNSFEILNKKLSKHVFNDSSNLAGLCYWKEYPHLFSLVFNNLKKEHQKIWMEIFEWTNLMIFSFNNNIKALKNEVQKKPNEINYLNLFGQTAVYLACFQGHLEVLKILVKQKNCDINKASSHQSPLSKMGLYSVSPLAIASMRGHSEIVKFLIDIGADVNAKSLFGHTPLYFAVQYNNNNVIRELLNSKNIEIDGTGVEGYTPLFIASMKGYTEIAKTLIENGANINFDYGGCTPLMISLYRQNFNTFKMLLEKGANVNVKNNNGSTLLMAAISENNFDVVQLLLETQVCEANEADFMMFTPLMMAAFKNNANIIRLLLKYGANVNEKEFNFGLTALHMATISNHFESIKVLVEAECDVDYSTNHHGMTALMLAVLKGNIKIIKYLVISGKANVNYKNKAGETALIIASIYGQTDIVIFLISRGADVNAKSVGGFTALHIAAEKNHINTAKSLIGSGKCDIDEANNIGWTPLINASNEGFKDMVRLLIDSGANLNCISKDGVSAKFLALSRKHFEILVMLCSEGAKVNVYFHPNLSSLFKKYKNEEELKY